MNITRLIPVLAGIALVAACSSTAGTATSASSVAVPPVAATAPSSAAPSAVAAAPVASPSPVATADLTCADFDLGAAHLLTFVHYAALNVGTNNDSSPALGDMLQAMAVMNAMAPECAPEAVEPLAALGDSAAQAAATYQPGEDPGVVNVDKMVLEDVQAAGLVAWKAMGKDVAQWDRVLEFYN